MLATTQKIGGSRVETLFVSSLRVLGFPARPRCRWVTYCYLSVNWPSTDLHLELKSSDSLRTRCIFSIKIQTLCQLIVTILSIRHPPHRPRKNATGNPPWLGKKAGSDAALAFFQRKACQAQIKTGRRVDVPSDARTSGAPYRTFGLGPLSSPASSPSSLTCIFFTNSS